METCLAVSVMAQHQGAYMVVDNILRGAVDMVECRFMTALPRLHVHAGAQFTQITSE